MRLQVILMLLVLLSPGCIDPWGGEDDEKSIKFNGRDLEGSDVYKFTLEDAQGPLWNLTDQEGKVVILVFMFTRCYETCPVTSQNIKVVEDTLTQEELNKTSIVSVTSYTDANIGYTDGYRMLDYGGMEYTLLTV